MDKFLLYTAREKCSLLASKHTETNDVSSQVHNDDTKFRLQ